MPGSSKSSEIAASESAATQSATALESQLGSSAGGFNTVTYGLLKVVADFAHAHITEVGAALARQTELIRLLPGTAELGS